MRGGAAVDSRIVHLDGILSSTAANLYVHLQVTFLFSPQLLVTLSIAKLLSSRFPEGAG